MSSFAFKKEFLTGGAAHSSLSETMSLDADHVISSYLTEFEGPDLKQI
jgi:hypothetical protein